MCKQTFHSTNWEGCPNEQCPVDAPEQDSQRVSDLQLGQESLPQPNSIHPQGSAPPDPLPGMHDPQPLPVPLASTEQCHAPFSTDIEPSIEEDPVPGPMRQILLPAPNTSSSPNPSPEDEPLVDQTVTTSLGDQELASSDAKVKIALAPVVAAAGVESPPVASEVTPDFTPASASGLSPESVPSLSPRSDIDRP
ncbi:uncharacterized protein [Macrobrachium rosenbergii]|uniref:uncharacterized protein n=1 Tax=Macrobrachium rosenbergii TaxID=79674 RepID=UPI0034D57254